MRIAAWLAVAFLMLPGLAVAQQPGEGQGRPTAESRMEEQTDRRSQLEERVRQQFANQVARRLALDSAQQRRMREVLTTGADERRALAFESQRLRLDLMEAVQSDDTPTRTYQDILARLDRLREGERDIERREEAALAEFLDPRQRAMFLFMRMRFNDQVRQMMGRRGGGMGPGAGFGNGSGPGGGGSPLF